VPRKPDPYPPLPDGTPAHAVAAVDACRDLIARLQATGTSRAIIASMQLQAALAQLMRRRPIPTPLIMWMTRDTGDLLHMERSR
jgi:hypothetical protein